MRNHPEVKADKYSSEAENANDCRLVGKVHYYLNSLKQLVLNSIVDNEGWQL